MTRAPGHSDRVLVLLLVTLIVGGAAMFTSAAFGLIARGGLNTSSVFISHLGLGVGLGLVGMFITASIDYTVWRKYAPYFFILTLLVTVLVFVPHVGMLHGGGHRWILISRLSFQPSELLKLSSIILASSYCVMMRDKIKTLQFGLGGLCAILAGPGLILLMQPDLGTLGVICVSVIAIFLVAGARFSHLLLLFVVAVCMIATLAFFKPYVRDRIETFLHPTQGQQAQSYQLKQSLIAIGSGSVIGRGFGQGIQKFTYLPEPMGDSIFAVLGEELGFVGTVVLVLLFLAFALRGYSVSIRAGDPFGVYLGTGITTYFIFEAFVNISAMLGIAPLTGIPLTFISQGGSAMLVSLTSAGILLRVSRIKRIR
ncbi:MAG: hypothetical protein JWO50_658 [Candidatus Kaiserbacteria bacterium]|nr:hypothetical protein [Candidatus Kaiserbacteria bacterium]